VNKQDRVALRPIVRGLRELKRIIEMNGSNSGKIPAINATMGEYAASLADAILDVMMGKQ